MQDSWQSQILPGQSVQVEGPGTADRAAAAGAPSAGREMGFGWASADPACRFNLGQSELKRV